MVIPLVFVVDVEDQLTFLKLKFIFLKGGKKNQPFRAMWSCIPGVNSKGVVDTLGLVAGTLEPDSAQGAMSV